MAVQFEFSKKAFHLPPLNEVADVLNKGLAKYFSYVAAEVVDCPDLSQEPYSLASAGICGKPTIVDIGSLPISPLIKQKKNYEFIDFVRIIGLNPCLAIGAGVYSSAGKTSDGVFNVLIENERINSKSRIVKLDGKSGGFFQEVLPSTDAKCASPANLLCSEGKQGKVLKVHCKQRITNENNFITCIRKSLAEFYGEKILGVGGVFLIKEGTAKQHVIPDTSNIPNVTMDDIIPLIRVFDMSAPLTVLGTFMTGDYDLSTMIQHFHSFSNHGDAGHYRYDITPETIEYLGYFNLAENVCRIDQPKVIP